MKEKRLMAKTLQVANL